MSVYAIVAAGGSGSRMGSNIPKQYLTVNDKPLLYYTLEAFETSCVNGVSVAVSKDWMQYVVSDIVDKYRLNKVIRVCEGGAERHVSVFHALDDLSDVAKVDDIILIQDGARPFVTADLIAKIADGVKEFGAAIAAVPVKDTIKISDADGFVRETTVRANTWQIQTPQGFYYGEILEAYRRLFADASRDNVMITDDAMVYERAFPEKKVKLIKAFYENIKITTAEDLEVAKARL
ncbi:MAG: 2-C-methyl-D-erythritol 4-phosphate cytidylyltransferase [Lachnospiraceae bacterium]|nr:2-C-methyl-D-erythritol 4-phosphate cytidylyltransferase [Lachnospiraceae bacterium]